ncbi:MAG: hypothetical protein ACKOTB_11510 [Planctomycetia bacterium]
MMQGLRRRSAAWALVAALAAGWPAAVTDEGPARAARAEEPALPADLPVYRVDAEAFEAREADIRGVLDSVSRELWRFFPDHEIEPIVVLRGDGPPITLFQRNELGEIVIRLNTGRMFWSQYAYQYAHELCHVLCAAGPGYQGNRWFEETLCETASLFAMRAMARTWKHTPPFANWRDYRDSLRDYTDEILRGRERVHEIFAVGLPAFYRGHRAELERDPGGRELNGAMAVVFLQFFEEDPARWESVRWLNATRPRDGDSFQTYLQNWHDAVPAKHRPFVTLVADLYAMPIRTAAGDEPTP